MNRDLPLHVAVPVWGESYVDTYLRFSLPAQLSAGNLPALPPGLPHAYTIYTTKQDFARISGHPLFAELKKHIPVTAEFIDRHMQDERYGQPGGKYWLKSNCYREALRKAATENAGVVALNADIIFADGFIRTAAALLREGKRVIEVAGPRGVRDAIGAALVRDHQDARGIITVSPLQLSKLWLENIHSNLRMHFVEGLEGEPFHPSHLYWRAGRSLIIRAFHLYPIVVVPGSSRIAFTSTIDDDLVGNLGLAASEIAIADDSRRMFCCELSAEDAYVGTSLVRGDLRGYAGFYRSYSSKNLPNLHHPIVVFGLAFPLNPVVAAARFRSQRFVNKLEQIYNELADGAATPPTTTFIERFRSRSQAIAQRRMRMELDQKADALRARLSLSSPEQLDEIYALYAEFTGKGVTFPLDIEEHSLRLILTHLRPDDDAVAERLAVVLEMQGKSGSVDLRPT